jgi:hypothetical protein
MLASRMLKRGSYWLALLLVITSLLLSAAAPAAVFPDVISVPNGFQPEGFTVGNGTTFYVGSIPTGAIYSGDLLTGQGAILVPAQSGRMAIGLKYDSRTDLLYVAGGPTGSAFVYNASTGANVATISLTSPGSTFVNDVTITQDAVYFTDSFQPVLYKVPLESNGQLPSAPTRQVIPLSGDFVFTSGGFNLNGIVATPNNKTLIAVSDTQSALLNIDQNTGVASLIDVGQSLPFGDGLWLVGHTLYVVQNQLNQVAVVQLNSTYTSGVVTGTLTSSALRVPTTGASFGNNFYVVNARFGTPPTPDTQYEVVKLPQ